MNKKRTEITNKLLKWFETNGENYPWRTTDNLYQILITEILLQKTIASNVKNLFNKFFKKYKNFSAIHKTDVAELQADIEFLGLSNKRAQILKDLSQLVVNEFDGVIPEEPEILKRIKGIADYVSNAYLCFGLNKKTLFFDVNIKRFVSRIFGESKPKQADIEEKLAILLPESNCKNFYWAILDFGSKICSKKNPKCELCPINNSCSYFGK